ncbi:MAG: HD domain-containing protein [Oscillospiraceae bacterium]|nr:HD domain-containing protein [Oscillospiraceae bacterium]
MSARNKFISAYTDIDELLNNFSNPLRSHSRRIAVCSAVIAEYAGEHLRPYGFSGTKLAVSMHLGGTCHDIGKLVLPTLASAEDDYLRHPVYGAELLEKNKDRFFINEAQAQMVLEIVRCHHEQADGNGFPEGLQEDDIPLPAAICYIANELDYLLYAAEKGENSGHGGMNDGFIKIKEQAGRKFCKIAAACFERAWTQLTELYAEWNQIN